MMKTKDEELDEDDEHVDDEDDKDKKTMRTMKTRTMPGLRGRLHVTLVPSFLMNCSASALLRLCFSVQ